MREFSKYEIRKAKCPVCGCRNKLVTSLLRPVDKKMIGFTMKCCNCGRFDTFHLDSLPNGSDNPNPPTEYGIQECFQPSYCRHTDCRFHKICRKNFNGTQMFPARNPAIDEPTISVTVCNPKPFL